MNAFDAKRALNEINVRATNEVFDEGSREPQEPAVPRVQRYHGCEDQPRFDVINFGPGGVIPCFTIKEAIMHAKSSKARHVEIYEHDRYVMTIRKRS